MGLSRRGDDMVKTETKIICDRCGSEMATVYGHKWFVQRMKRSIKILHEVPSYNRVDEYHFCDKCAWDFAKWKNEVKANEQ